MSMTPRPEPVLGYFLLVFMLSVPFLVIGAGTDVQLLPGLPLSSTVWVCPAVAAAILVYRKERMAGVKRLLARAFDYRRITARVWYVPVFGLMPLVALLAYGILRLAGVPLPAPRVPVATALGLFLAFFVAGAGEELGWSGYVTDPMQARWSALGAAVLLGLVWAAWHIVPLLQAHRAPAWIAWWGLSTVALRVLTVWLYNNTGKSVFATILFHDMSNLVWQLFPNRGSHYDPRVFGSILAIAAIAVAVGWGPRTLVREGLRRREL